MIKLSNYQYKKGNPNTHIGCLIANDNLSWDVANGRMTYENFVGFILSGGDE